VLIISAPTFVAFILFSTDGKVRNAHHPLDYMQGWTASRVASHCKGREAWSLTVIELVNHHEINTPN
jgi:hypothetical protein